MASTQEFFSSDKNRYTPLDMPCSEWDDYDLRLYSDSAGTSDRYQAGNDFWAKLGPHASYASSLSSSAWTTTVDITGSGHLGGVGSGKADSNVTATHEMRITIDDVLYERSMSSHQSNTRMYLGTGMIPAAQHGSSTYTPGRFKQYQHRVWYSHNSSSATYKKQWFDGNTNYFFVPTFVLMAEGLPTVPFRESLKVEQKISYNASSNYNGHHFAMYHITG